MYLGGPLRVLLGFNPPFPLILLNPEGNRYGTRKGIKFWIERLIVNSAGELGFRATQFQIYFPKNNIDISGSGYDGLIFLLKTL